MIRDRRDQDLDRLCAILETLEQPAASLHPAGSRGWLLEHEAERSWVFDMAPVRVAPTRNVVGHVQIYRPTDASLTGGLARTTGWTADDLLVIGRLFVRPDRHDQGIGRFLLTESVRQVRSSGKLPVLDLRENGFSKAFFARRGFVEVDPDDPDAFLMVHARG